MKIEVEENDGMEIAVPNSVPAEIQALDTHDEMMMRVIESGNIEGLERFIALREREERRQAEKMFNENFARMQAEFLPIRKTKKGDKAKYAPLELMERQYRPIISKHGFAYYWDEEATENGGMNITMTVSGYGHSKTTTKFLPAYVPDKGSSSGKSIMNAMQAEGVRSTYGRRYTFKSGFGVTEEGEDTDGFVPVSRKDPREEWRDKWIAEVNALGLDPGATEALTDKVEAAYKSGNHDEAEAVRDEIKAMR